MVIILLIMVNIYIYTVYIHVYIYISGWWLTYPSETLMSSSVGIIIPNILYGKMTNVPNQPDMVCITI